MMVEPRDSSNTFSKQAVEATIQIGALVLLAAWCLQIVRPFLIPLVWGMIIAVSLFPAYQRAAALLAGRRGLTAGIFTLLMLMLLVGPTVLLARVVVENAQGLAGQLHAGTLAVPPPPAGVAEWPLVGAPIAKAWSLASTNLEAALRQLEPHYKTMATGLLRAAAGTGLALLQFFAAVVVSGILLANSGGAHRLAQDIGRRLAGERGREFADLAQATVRSVVRGVLGVALIQALLAGVGLVAVGIPAAGLWAVICLVLAVIQVGVVLVMLPAVIYVFSTADPVTATLFLVWSIFVSLIDNLLKPLLMGRGVDVPMIVIFVGAIGGMLASGILGLFIGAVVLALGYKLFVGWLAVGREAPEAAEEAG
jgi:predicted PurR-regulated permease PerM